MNKYESVIIVEDSLKDSQKEETVNKMKDFITKNGELTNMEIIGSRTLAYEIRKQKKGYYVVFNFNAKPTVIAELERIYRITDEIMKFMTIKQD